MTVHPLEAELLLKIRNRFQWGDVTIECRDGLPHRIIKAFDATKLSPTDLNSEDLIPPEWEM